MSLETKESPVSQLAGAPLDGKISRPRLVALDAFRGLAILFMMVDHFTLVLGGPHVFRLLPGRLAMPMFFLLAGYLARSPRWRHAGIYLVGLALPLLVPWIDSPNVLTWWALGVLVLWLARYCGVPVWLVAAVGLTAAANGWAHLDGSSYDARSLFGLMALGAMLPLTAFSWASRLPGWVAAVGRHPILWYVGHLCCLEVFLIWATS